MSPSTGGPGLNCGGSAQLSTAAAACHNTAHCARTHRALQTLAHRYHYIPSLTHNCRAASLCHLRGYEIVTLLVITLHFGLPAADLIVGKLTKMLQKAAHDSLSQSDVWLLTHLTPHKAAGFTLPPNTGLLVYWVTGLLGFPLNA